MQSSIRNVKFSSETTQISNSTNYINKTGLNEETIEHCKTNLVNYYVCYGSAVVSVRNAERRIIY